MFNSGPASIDFEISIEEFVFVEIASSCSGRGTISVGTGLGVDSVSIGSGQSGVSGISGASESESGAKISTGGSEIELSSDSSNRLHF